MRCTCFIDGRKSFVRQGSSGAAQVPVCQRKRRWIGCSIAVLIDSTLPMTHVSNVEGQRVLCDSGVRLSTSLTTGFKPRLIFVVGFEPCAPVRTEGPVGRMDPIEDCGLDQMSVIPNQLDGVHLIDSQIHKPLIFESWFPLLSKTL